MEKTLGGDRLGAGKKMKVHLHNYGRSTHNMGYIWRSTMSAGTLVPFLSEVALPGDTFDIDLDCDVKTHPTIGPLFGSYKVQLDIFQAPIRLYNSMLHNNKLGIGMDMGKVKLPLIRLQAYKYVATDTGPDASQINPSCLLAYLGIRGVGMVDTGDSDAPYRDFNAIPILAYWEIFKNYYANKQEDNAYVIWPTITTGSETPQGVDIDSNTLPQWPSTSAIPINRPTTIVVQFASTPTVDDAGNVLLILNEQGTLMANLANLIYGTPTVVGNDLHVPIMNLNATVWAWQPTNIYQPITAVPTLKSFPLSNIDSMRDTIIGTLTGNPVIINNTAYSPYSLYTSTTGFNPMTYSQSGLAVKTYQSDLLNNWLSTEWIDGVGGITEITAIDTSGGSFTLDTLNLSKKVYDMLNRIAVSGGSYDDWIDAVYTHDRYVRAESPIYEGSLIKELVFQEIISNAETINNDNTKPIGTLAGKGVLAQKHKGGKIVVHVNEPSYIIGIVSLTPRIDYSQGNKWDVHLKTMNDLHKPALDEIGFQELITEQMAWWDTQWTSDDEWVTKSAGKQPAWINYMTNINRTYGNFALEGNEMFMTLNRRYEFDTPTTGIKDLTTYIDPVKFNFIFAETALDAQNFWVQIAVDMTARRKMSAKVMPNL